MYKHLILACGRHFQEMSQSTNQWRKAVVPGCWWKWLLNVRVCQELHWYRSNLLGLHIRCFVEIMANIGWFVLCGYYPSDNTGTNGTTVERIQRSGVEIRSYVNPLNIGTREDSKLIFFLQRVTRSFFISIQPVTALTSVSRSNWNTYCCFCPGLLTVTTLQTLSFGWQSSASTFRRLYCMWIHASFVETRLHMLRTQSSQR